MARAEKTKRTLGGAMERLLSHPTITVDDWAVLNDVNRNTAYAEAAAGKIDGAYKVGALYRITSATWRAKLGITAQLVSAEPEQVAA